MDKFDVLPTDMRFINLYEEQKIALFEGINDLPERDQLKRTLAIMKKKEEIKSKKDEEFVSEGLIKRIKQVLRSRGASVEEIEKEIKRVSDARRKTELLKLEELRNE